MKTLIAVPCMDMVAAPFAQSLATLNKEGECLVSFLIGSLIYESRNTLAKQCITHNCDGILWLDSDMAFDADILHKMLEHAKAGREIVTGLYFRRRPPYTPVLFSDLKLDDQLHWEGVTDYPESELFEVAGCGFGCCYTSKNVLLDVLLNYQTWFTPLEHAGEDIAFCVRARELGHTIWCDPTIKCGHVGVHMFDESVYKASLNK